MRGIRLSERSGRGLVLIGYALLLAVIAVATANIDPFNSDTVANLVAISNIRPDGILYAVAHTNALKAPLYLLSLALFGYSQNALVFIDIVSTIGFSALLFVCLLRWTRSYAWPHLAAVPLLYLAALSPLFVILTTHPGLRILDIGVSFVWLGVALSERLKSRYRLLAIPLAALLVLNDPWFVTTFALPAVLLALLGLKVSAPAIGARESLRIVALILVGVALGFALRAAIEATGIVKFVGAETSYNVVATSQLGGNLGLTVEILLRYFNAWVFGQPLVSLAVVVAVGNLALVGFEIGGLLFGVRSSERSIRRICLFTLVSAASNLILFVFTNAPSDMWSGRYIIVAPIAVAIGLAILLIQSRGERRALRLGVLGLLVVCLAVNAASAAGALSQMRSPARNAPSQRILDALTRSGLVYGYSDFWNSLNYPFLSGRALHISPVTCESGRLVPLKWWSQSLWYAPNPAHRPSFILINATDQIVFPGCRPDALIQQFGPATTQSIDDGSVHVADVLIWDYDIAPSLPR